MKFNRRGLGFSLLEILITTGVVALGLLALMGALAYATKASRAGELASLAMGHSIHCLELIRSRNLDFAGTLPPPSYSGINDAPSVRKDMNAYPFNTDFEPGMAFKRNISITRQGTAGNYNYDVVVIKVSIYWFENGGERNVTFEATHKKP